MAAAAGGLSWAVIESAHRGKPGVLGAVTGAVAGLVAITPAAGGSGPLGAMILAAVAAGLCYGFVASLKNRLRLDDTLDVFGIHGLGGIAGSLGTAIVTAPALGGHGAPDYSVPRQLLVQAAAVLIAILWSAAGSALAFWVVNRTIGLRVGRDQEREGLDLADHGERAYNY
jgi:Amt family ammonium transporter